MYKYLTYLPENYESSSEKFPLIIFLHGAPQRGNDSDDLKKEGLPKELEAGLSIPFIVVVPHCKTGTTWYSQGLYDMLNEVSRLYRVDKKRLYLTGFSMGGFGVLKFIRDYPGLFAAAAPICSGGSKFFAETISAVPLWFFHGAKDTVVEIENTKTLVEELEKHNANVRFTIYPDKAHDIWDITYKNKELYEWFLENTL